MNKKKYSAIVLDMDGTIIDSLETAVMSLKKAGRNFGLDITEQHIQLAMFSSGESLLKELDTGADFLAHWMEIYEEESHNVHVFPGIKELLAVPVKRGIVTSETHDELLANLEKSDFSAGDFLALVGADDTEYEKPSPFPLLHCLNIMNVSTDEALFIGDSTNDMLCAYAAGVDFGLAVWGAGTTQGFDSAKYFFEKPQDIIKFI